MGKFHFPDIIRILFFKSLDDELIQGGEALISISVR